MAALCLGRQQSGAPWRKDHGVGLARELSQEIQHRTGREAADHQAVHRPSRDSGVNIGLAVIMSPEVPEVALGVSEVDVRPQDLESS
ncbi:MAG: hypothetical protein M3Y33_07175 [Actinomycetota bacterium]|nr:hypothetical protein [Actinomycetota bacterium]